MRWRRWERRGLAAVRQVGGGACGSRRRLSSVHREAESHPASGLRVDVAVIVRRAMLSCSQQSIFTAMERFVRAVDNVSATVLVPSKLRDMDTAGRKRSRIPAALAHCDLHSFYLMLDAVKKELLWGPGSGASAAAVSTSDRTVTSSTHVRQPSDESLASLSAGSDTDSEVDSLLTDRDSVVSDEPHHTSHLAAAFRHHMQGLHTILHQLADSADYLCVRYQEEVDAEQPSL